MENFFQRLEIYTRVSPPPEMIDIIVKIVVEVLSILGIATKEMKQGRMKKYLKKLIGKTDIEDALKRLDRLTNEEVRMVTAQVLEATHTVDDKVAAVIDEGKETRVVIQQVADDMDQVKRNQLRQELRKWLSPPDPSINHNIACGAHRKQTAEWFFQGSIFTEWKSNGSLLWLHGKPGSGKSVLCSTIVQDVIALRDNRLASMAYFYFDFRDINKQNRRDLLPSLLTQLSDQSHRHCDILNRLYLKHGNGAQKPSEDELIQCLKDMLTLPDQQPVYLVIDALDECPDTSGMPSPREQVLDLVNELVELSSPNLRLCVTSRPEIDIRRALEPLTSLRVSLHEQSGQKQDIVDYVTSVDQSDAKMRRWRDEDKNLVIETLSERADGMFRWAFCQLEALRHCLAPRVRHMLKELPETLDETYERILKDINKANWDHAHRLLQCLTVAVRPLRVTELAEVLAVDFGTAYCGGTSKLNTDWRWEDQEEAVLSTCSSLISVVDDEGSQIVQFSHFSVKEFLTSSRIASSSADVLRFRILLEPAHTILAKACLGVLMRLGEVKHKFPLARYACKHWVDHARFENVSSHVREGMGHLFDPDKPYFAAWVQVHNFDTMPHHPSVLFYFANFQKPKTATPLYYAALCGFHDLAEQLIIKHPQQVNATGGHYVSPLGAALSGGHLKIAQLLYERGADVDVQGNHDWTPLYGASQFGHLETVQWLLSCSANPNFRGKLHGYTPQHLAAHSGYVEISRLLLQYKADTNAQDHSGQTPLMFASGQGHVNVARLLLEQGADVNAQDNGRNTPLHHASRRGRPEVARLLVEHGANIDAEDDEGRTAFQVASEEGHHDIAKCLSDHGSK
ncbi:hypothetical protein F5888DRAFT_1926146 [Russula emetica]|nr:hypothetical protein F5888DRAFT_1926146 [Russula emetica]